jgi:hypothetical protein
MLDTDNRAAAEAISAQFADTGVPQFWDGKKLLGWEVSRSFGVTERAAWDIYLFYPPGSEWTDAGLPRAEKALIQAGGGVVAMKGTLPPRGDQSRVPPWGKGMLDLVGQPPELARLLSEVAVPYLQQYQREGQAPTDGIGQAQPAGTDDAPDK